MDILFVSLLWFIVSMIYFSAYEQVLLTVWKGPELLYIVYIDLVKVAD